MSPRDDTPDSQDQPQVSGAGEAPVNPEAPARPVTPSDGDAGGGIFSTPELTVNTENAAVEGTELSDENKSRIAAAFQSTDATQKQQEAQAMNAAALAASDIPSTATGDIKLQGEKKRRKKWPVVVLLVLLLALIGGGVWYWLQGQQSNETPKEPKTTEEAFSVYLDLMKNGSAGDYFGNTPTTWYFYRMRNGEATNASLSSYTDSLKTAYDAFYGRAVNGKNSDKQLLDAYDVRFDLWLKYISLPMLRQNLTKTFVDEGGSAALDYIQALTSYDSNDDNVAMSTYSFLNEYLRSELNLVELYVNFGCVLNYELDSFCLSDRADGSVTYRDLAQAQQSAEATLNDAMVNFLWSDFVAETEALISIYGDGNA